MSKQDDTANVWLYGDASVASNGAMTLPAEARRDIGLEDGGKVLVFRAPGRVILTPAPLADELLKFAADRAVARSAEASAESDM